MEEEKQGKGFVIKDRRFFDESGTAREADDMKTEAEKPSGKTVEPESVPADDGPDSENTQLPEINFSSFIFSLSTTAMYHFGDFPDPVTKKSQRNLPAAKQTIDILNILKEKTEGNLDKDEKSFLDSILYELRMRFIKETAEK